MLPCCGLVMPSNGWEGEHVMAAHDSTWVKVLDLEESPVDQPQPVTVEGRDLIIFRHGERYVLMDRWCPHQNGDLAEGQVIGRALKCPLHGFMFSVDAGRGLNCPGFTLRVHEVRVENGYLSVRLT
jgi:nitrite reductase/ring-hydroxylating ferredoxin subunit